MLRLRFVDVRLGSSRLDPCDDGLLVGCFLSQRYCWVCCWVADCHCHHHPLPGGPLPLLGEPPLPHCQAGRPTGELLLLGGLGGVMRRPPQRPEGLLGSESRLILTGDAVSQLHVGASLRCDAALQESLHHQGALSHELVGGQANTFILPDGTRQDRVRTETNQRETPRVKKTSHS